jgi:serine protease
VALPGCWPFRPLLVFITSPEESDVFTKGDPITFSAIAKDWRGRSKSGIHYRWTSSMDGDIGDTHSFSRSDLSVGEHGILAVATDSQENWAMDVISIEISP